MVGRFLADVCVGMTTACRWAETEPRRSLADSFLVPGSLNARVASEATPSILPVMEIAGDWCRIITMYQVQSARESRRSRSPKAPHTNTVVRSLLYVGIQWRLALA